MHSEKLSLSSLNEATAVEVTLARVHQVQHEGAIHCGVLGRIMKKYKFKKYKYKSIFSLIKGTYL